MVMAESLSRANTGFGPIYPHQPFFVEGTSQERARTDGAAGPQRYHSRRRPLVVTHPRVHGIVLLREVGRPQRNNYRKRDFDTSTPDTSQISGEPK